MAKVEQIDARVKKQEAACTSSGTLDNYLLLKNRITESQQYLKSCFLA
jgi:hypothetical protein